MSVSVLPRKCVLDGHGNVWEYLLARAGWNELPPEKKIGHIVAAYEGDLVDVMWPALEHTSHMVFTDEIALVEP